ncbi:MAG TPA: PQQ-binding-like beta-propeller repeat protein [Gemmatimonadales bacterium]|nr:PQQ-binding-like beta-propeller repeat protein [Gemmatimonadales bacterium]
MGAGLVNAACAYVRPIPDAPLAADSTHAAPLTQRWLARVNQGFLGPMLLRNDTLIGAGYDRRVVAVELSRGSKVWELRLNGGASAGVVGTGDTIFSASDRPDGSVQAMRRASGAVVWRRRHTGRIALPLLLTDSLVIAAPSTGSVLALDRANGDRRWTRRMAPLVAPAQLGAPGELVALTSDSIYRLSLADGKVIAAVPTSGSASASWVRADPLLVLAAGTGDVSAIRPGDLSIAWHLHVDGPVLVPPAVFGDTLWIVTQTGSIYRIPMQDPKVERFAEFADPVSAPPTPWRSWVLVGMADGTLRALGADGVEAWRVAVGRPLVETPIALPDGIIIVGGRGDIHRMVLR